MHQVLHTVHIRTDSNTEHDLVNRTLYRSFRSVFLSLSFLVFKVEKKKNN